MAQAGQADLLVTGDKRDLLSLSSHQGTRILTVREAKKLDLDTDDLRAEPRQRFAQ